MSNRLVVPQPNEPRRAACRVCCLHIPLFPLAARLRSEPELRNEAVAVFAGSGKKAALVAATRRARRGGVKVGMTPTQARALMPNIIVRARDQECERAAQETLIEVASGFSPRVQDDTEGAAFLDITGLDRHFPGPSPEVDLAQSLLVATEKCGLPTWLGIASSTLAARIAADTPPSPQIVPARQEATFLAPLPLERLCSESGIYATLKRWGINTIGEFAALPRNQVASRLGPAGHRLHEQSRGLEQQPFVPRTSPPVFHEGMDLDWPLVTLEPFLFVGSRAVERLCQRLEACGLACARLSLSLRLEPEGFHERSITLPAPTNDARTLLTLSRLDLEQSPPGAPVIGFTFTAYPDRPREAQLSIFGPSAPSPDRLATTLARLFALLGPGRAGAPSIVDSHAPERFRLIDFAPPPPPETELEPRPGKGLLAARTLRPAVPLDVESRPESDPPTPVAVRPTAGGSGREIVIAGKVRVAAGPWRVEDEWWSDAPSNRDYWDIELSDGGVYRLFHERRTKRWYADGVYD